jgi:hypothetical protein
LLTRTCQWQGHTAVLHQTSRHSTAALNTHHRLPCEVCCWLVPNDQTEEACKLV